jgi:TonB-linked SusC/RagA family outer membrane protein
MNKKILSFLTLVSLLFFQGVVAQNSTVSGTVSDDSGSPLPGVNVVEKGTSNGTSTDFDGNYTISVGNNATLVFSSLGYERKEVAVNGQSTVNTSLAEDASQLDEVVVTALGIKKDRRSLGYAVTQVEGTAVSEVKTTNALNALQGKIAGVNITPPATGAGGSSRVVIRGASSLTGANQPLYVVDGVTIDNTQLGAASEWGGSDFGDGISSINPDDIESISVLKGGAAGALYGSRASGGVVIITTKSGKDQEGFGVEYSTQVTFDNIQEGVRDFQREYGQGSQGIAPSTATEAQDQAFSSWGPRLGSIPNSVQYDGVSRPYTDTGDNLSRFYRTGSTFINTVGISKGGEDFNYRFGITNLDNEDVVPGSSLNRKSFSFNASTVHKEKLTANVSARYIIEKVSNRPRISDTPGNANFAPAVLPANVNVVDLGADRNGALPDGTEDQNSSNPFVQNPYWAASRFTTFDRNNRLLSSATVRYDILDWLSITARAGVDHQNIRSTRISGFGTAFIPFGNISEVQTSITQVDSDLILGIDKQINDDFKVEANFGLNKNTQRNDLLQLNGNQFVIPFLEILGNVQNASRSRTLNEVALSGVYGSVEVSYKDMLYLTATGRNDWFSTLSAAGKETPNNEFYPSINGSFVFSEVLDTDWLTFGRLRASYSEVAGGADVPYGLSLPFAIIGQGHLGQPLGGINSGTVPNAALTPFLKTETEVGLDLSFFENRLALDLSYYTNTTDGDILPVPISLASGFSSVRSNLGVVKNEGIEVLLSGAPIRNENFKWNTSINLTFNESLVESTDPAGNDVNSGNVRTFAANIIQRPGERFGKIFGTAYLRDNGQIVYGADGLPIINPERQILGDGVPPWTVGWNNSFNYKNFNLSFLIDGKFGGQIYSGTNSIAYGNGLHKNTLQGREGGLTVTGVDEAGNPFTFTHDDTTLQAYYGRLGAIAEEVTYDSDFIKLRQLSFGYTFPSSILENTFMESATISFVGRDLFFISRSTDNINPESAFNAGNGQGLEYFGLPPIGNYGLTLNIKF